MKKVILLFIILFTITGCYDYQELNDRAIVSGISIDYINEEYIVNYEILNNLKSDEPENKAYMVEGSGETIVEAFQDASDSISKETYLSHLKVLILSEEAAKEKMRDIVDYMLREPYIRNIFSPVIAKDVTAKSILGSTDKETPVVSEKIETMIANNKYNENISLKIDFDHFMDQFEDDRIDPSLTAIELVDGKPALAGIAIFDDGKLKDILNPELSAIFKVLNNDSSNHSLKIPCENKTNGYTIINLYKNKNTDLEIKDDTLNVKSKLNAGVLKDSCGLNFRDGTIYEELSTKFEKNLKEEYQTFWNYITFDDTDILGLRKKYYQKSRQELPNWKDLKLEMEVKITINKNGKTFEVRNNE
ncbi:MAG: Ger(x)C family spore germination protein [Bacilli bacterium]|nr:Ger(x)C family spore germination protein [Bacilli bacterium]